ncbi:erythromycin esterase family protein [Salinicoccus sp. RF5]|uniref:erythromycin esterase family protein n=1 Tax=Salinicoccus sp. RF5 TaxID=2748874 RepID=UPI001E5A2A27|nr:erythromycin esterase family protein [Salinicoccus sp. RF5]MCC4723314.1 erythromycin esterase family protein [Salinicoccus sp. RF5]
MRKKFLKGVGTLLITTSILVGCGTDADESSENSADYYELNNEIEDIGDILGDHDIVILGESTHWSSEIAKQKTDLIDHLAEHHDFNILFLETGDSEFNYYQQSGLPMTEGVSDQYRQESFNKYLAGIAENIKTLPMDWKPVFSGNRASAITTLEENIVTEISGYSHDLAEEFKRSEFALRDWFSKGVLQGKKVGHLERSTNVYEDIRNQSFFNKLTSETQNYIISRQENIEKYYSKISFEDGVAEYNDYREIGMSEKVLEQMDSNDKAIVWVANLHSNYDVASIDYTNEVYVEDKMNERVESLGALLQESDYSVYNAGLFHNEADDYEILPEDYATPRSESDETLEGYIGNRVQKDIFIDFATSDFIEKNQYTVYWAGYYDYRMVPQEQFDGLIYIDHIKK